MRYCIIGITFIANVVFALRVFPIRAEHLLVVGLAYGTLAGSCVACTAPRTNAKCKLDGRLRTPRKTLWRGAVTAILSVSVGWALFVDTFVIVESLTGPAFGSGPSVTATSVILGAIIGISAVIYIAIREVNSL